MKATLLALSLLTLSSLAHADLAETHQAKCASADIVSMTGASGSCRVVITPKKVEKQGMCIGMFMGSLPCAVTYIANEEGAAMNLTCGTDPQKPVIDQDMAAEAVGYTVTTLIRKADGQDVIKTDGQEYLLVSNRMVDVSLTSATTADIGITLQSGRVALTNVNCQ